VGALGLAPAAAWAQAGSGRAAEPAIRTPDNASAAST
jgi:hypothetical protein